MHGTGCEGPGGGVLDRGGHGQGGSRPEGVTARVGPGHGRRGQKDITSSVPAAEIIS